MNLLLFDSHHTGWYRTNLREHRFQIVSECRRHTYGRLPSVVNPSLFEFHDVTVYVSHGSSAVSPGPVLLVEFNLV